MTRSLPRAALVVLLFFGSVFLFGQAESSESESGGLALGIQPGASFPVFGWGQVLNIGPAAEINVAYRFAGLPLYADAAINYTRTASAGGGVLISNYSGSAGAGAYFRALPFMNLRVGGRVGYGYLAYDVNGNSVPTSNLGWWGVVGVDVPLFNGLALGISGAVTANVSSFLGVEAGAGVVWTPGASGRERTPRERRPREVRPEPMDAVAEDEAAPTDSEAEVADDLRGEVVENTAADLALLNAGFRTVFPVFYRFYDDNPVGSARLRNQSDEAITNVELSVNIPRFMDVAQRQEVPVSIDPGEEVDVDLQVLFNDGLLGVTEGTRVAAEFQVSYEVDGEAEAYSLDTSLNVADRNAMTWDDDRKAASFVTAKDPTVLGFAKNVAGIVRSEGYGTVNSQLRTGMAMLEALALHGINYVIDPTTPYEQFSAQPYAVDFLQFPHQTFQFRAGDCDDLSICYTSLLQAVGIKSAFVTIPGHIYSAFATGLDERAARATFNRTDNLIMYEGEAWIPVETTILDQGFLEAWKIGARQWRENESRDQAKLIPIEASWAVYEPVGFDNSQRAVVTPPPPSELRRAYSARLAEYIEDEITPRVARLQRKVDQEGGTPRDYNRLGVVYAKYGRLDEAKRYFEQALGAGRSPDALLNLGNIHYLEDDYRSALDYFEQAEDLDPDNPAIVLAVARIHHELENYGFSARSYERLQQLSPDLALQFEYLAFRGSDASRASDVAQMQSIIIWGGDGEE